MRLPLMNFQFRGSSRSGPFVSVMAVAGLFFFFCSNSQPAWKKPMIVSEKQSVQKCIHHCSSFHRLANELEVIIVILQLHKWGSLVALVGPLAPSSCLALQPLAALQCVVTGPPLKLPSLFRKEKREPHACFALLAHNGMNYFLKVYSCLFV